MSNTPAGWYPDGQGAQRWWDGTQWTEHVQPGEESARAPDAPVVDEPTRVAAKPLVTPQPEPQPEPDVAPAAQDAGAGEAQAPQSPVAPGYPAVAAYPQQYGDGGGYPPAPAGYPQAPAWQAGQPGQPGQWGQPPHGPPGQPGQPGQQRRSGGVNKVLMAAIGGGVLVVIIVVVLLVVLLGGGGGSDTSSPESTVQSYLDASKDMDCDAIQKTIAPDFYKTVFGDQSCEDALKSLADEIPDGVDVNSVKSDVRDAQVDGDSATVAVDSTITIEGATQSVTLTYDLTKTGDDWLISGIETPDLSGAGSSSGSDFSSGSDSGSTSITPAG